MSEHSTVRYRFLKINVRPGAFHMRTHWHAKRQYEFRSTIQTFWQFFITSGLWTLTRYISNEHRHVSVPSKILTDLSSVSSPQWTPLKLICWVEGKGHAKTLDAGLEDSQCCDHQLKRVLGCLLVVLYLLTLQTERVFHTYEIHCSSFPFKAGILGIATLCFNKAGQTDRNSNQSIHPV